MRAWYHTLLSAEGATFYLPLETEQLAVLDPTHTEDDFPTVIGPGGFMDEANDKQGAVLYIEDQDGNLDVVSAAIELA